MTALLDRPLVATAARERPTRQRTAVVTGLLTVLAGALRLAHLATGFRHGVVGYDDGVYFGSALDLVNGRLPYRDFVFVQPPGLTLLLSPFALVARLTGTSTAMGLVKIATALAGTAAVPLAARLVRHRGILAVTVAGGVLALQGDSVASAYGALLEPWAVLAMLAGAVLLFRGGRPVDGPRSWWGAVLFGFAAAVKIWALVPALALVVIYGRGRRMRVAAGVTLGFAVPVLPFALAGPGAFLREVFLDQLGRTAVHRTGLVSRLAQLFSDAAADNSRPNLAQIVIAVLLGAGLLLSWLARRGPTDALDRFALSGGLLVLTMFLVPTTFFWHYVAFGTPFLALALALPLGRLPARARGTWLPVLSVLGGLALVLALVRVDSAPRLPDDAATVDRVVPAGACVVSTSTAALIAADRFDPACPGPLDAYGVVLAATHGVQPSPRSLAQASLQRRWLPALHHVDYVYLDRTNNPLFPRGAAMSYLHAHFRLVPCADPSGCIWVRR